MFSLSLGTSLKVKGERVYEKYPVSNLLGVVISVKGDLALQFASAYEYRSRRQVFASKFKQTAIRIETGC